MNRFRAWTCAAMLAGGGAWAQAGGEPAVKQQVPRLEGNLTFRDKAPEKVKTDIEQQARAFEQAFNAHDANKMAGQFTEEATYLDLQGKAVTGKSNIRQFMEKEHAGLLKDARLQLTVTSVRTVGDKLAIVDMAGVLSGLESGPEALPPHFHATAVASRQGRAWKMEALRTFPMPGMQETGVGGAGDAGTGGSGTVDPTKAQDSTATPPSGMGTSPLDQRNEDRLP
jgi:uncharacterized protein (TIGR02246 family)